MPQAGLIFQPPHWRGRMSASWEEANFVLSVSGSSVGCTKDNRFQPTARVQSFVTYDPITTFQSVRAGGLLSGKTLTVASQNLIHHKPNLIQTDEQQEIR